MNAAVMCEKCGKPLGVFEGNICNECENKEINDVLDKIRAEIEEKAWKIAISDTDRANGMWDAYRIINKYR